jgi:DNA-binding beta-propeller fold protein YncE
LRDLTGESRVQPFYPGVWNVKTRRDSSHIRRATILCAIASVLVLTAPTAGASAGGAQLWVQRYNGPGDGGDWGTSVVVSPDGSMVFVTGYSQGVSGNMDYATVAYDAATHARLWVQRYKGPDNKRELALSIAVSPDGSLVFVTGFSGGATTKSDYATVAYTAATGAQVWVQRYNGQGNGYDAAASVAVSPDSSEVFVTGTSSSNWLTSGDDYLTLAYDAATGTPLWEMRYDGRGNDVDLATSVSVSPDGSRVFVTGGSTESGIGYDYATISYDAATGTQQWVTRYNGSGNGEDLAQSVRASPDGSKVFITGLSIGAGSDFDYATAAYDVATGAEVWVQRYDGPGNGYDSAYSVDASPDGSEVFVTGDSTGTSTNADFATVAYDAATGTTLWGKRYNGSANDADGAYDVAASPDGSKVFVTGTSHSNSTYYGYTTVAYEAATGGSVWVQRYSGPGDEYDAAVSVAASPDGSKVFVTGNSNGLSSIDYATVAYSS